MIRHSQMSNIGNGAGDQKIANHLWLCSCVKHSDAEQREQAIDVRELEGEDA